MNLSPEVAALLRQALADAAAMPTTVSSYLVLKERIEKLLPTLLVVPVSECDNCGLRLPNFLLDGGLCPQCEAEYDEQVAEYEADHRLETALACKCGAWGINPVTSNVYHCADCVCGAE